MNQLTTLPRRQSGAVLLVYLLVFVIAAAFVLVSQLNQAATQAYRDDQTARALAEAKAALIGFAASDPNRPGELPCPDFNNDGQILVTGANRDYNGSACRTEAATGVIQPGWLPWERVRLSDLRDGNGDRLWYVVSDAYHANAASALNSDTPGQLTAGGVPDVVAIVFTPGLPLSGQNNRNCTSPPGTPPPPTCDATVQLNQFLEGGNEVGGPNVTYSQFFSPPPGSPNDQLITITRQDLMAAVEKRVAREIRARLATYYTTNQYYPFANEYSDLTFNCTSTTTPTRGRVPLSIASCSGLANWAPALPAWFANNNWHRLIYYTVAPACAYPNLNCGGAGGHLTVQNTPMPNNDKNALVIASGKALSGQSRACAAVTDCLDGPENTDSDDVYVQNPVSTTFNDKIVIVAP